MALQNYRDLVVWQTAMDLAFQTCLLVKTFPRHEMFGMTSQLRRAAMSIPANIAEGYGRHHRGDYLRFLSIARGSLCETETFLILAGRLEYANRTSLQPLWSLCQSTGKMLYQLVRSLSNTVPTPTNAPTNTKPR